MPANRRAQSWDVCVWIRPLTIGYDYLGRGQVSMFECWRGKNEYEKMKSYGVSILLHRQTKTLCIIIKTSVWLVPDSFRVFSYPPHAVYRDGDGMNVQTNYCTFCTRRDSAGAPAGFHVQSHVCTFMKTCPAVSQQNVEDWFSCFSYLFLHFFSLCSSRECSLEEWCIPYFFFNPA